MIFFTNRKVKSNKFRKVSNNSQLEFCANRKVNSHKFRKVSKILIVGFFLQIRKKLSYFLIKKSKNSSLFILNKSTGAISTSTKKSSFDLFNIKGVIWSEYQKKKATILKPILKQSKTATHKKSSAI